MAQDYTVASVDELEAQIGERPATIDLKVIDHLDEGALKWIAFSPLAMLGVGGSFGLRASIAGGAPGFIDADRTSIRVPRDSLDEDLNIEAGSGFGSLLLVPQIGETLRINGTVAKCTRDYWEVRVEECFIHCAKALIRSDFWKVAEHEALTDEGCDLLSSVRFLALVTMDDKGRVDVSPKGDPPGLLVRSSGDEFWIADRPGNLKADSFNNMLAQPKVAGLLLEPGNRQILKFSGNARPSTHPVKNVLAVDGKAPKIAMQVALNEISSRKSKALQSSKIWLLPKPALKGSNILLGHLRLNKEATLAKSLGSAYPPEADVLQQGLERDYSANLY
ncbi:MAG: pyridoxamine 5'-phosphate oxidase family protein [Pseudomonadota bacterium]